MISLFLFLCLSSIALQLHFILNPPIATIILIPKSQTHLTYCHRAARTPPPSYHLEPGEDRTNNRTRPPGRESSHRNHHLL